MRNHKLWLEIQQFQFDEPSDVYGFTLRLAKENCWTQDFTQRAVLEYRKFMYLAAVSEQMVSPSHIIDQVWHLHLIYTKSYDQLCQVLQKKVQHVPATHNPQEGKIFIDARFRTNQVYQQEFGTQPLEIWNNREMTDTLNLPKAKFKLRSFIIVGLFCIAALIPLLFFLLNPVYATISPGNFIAGYLVLLGLLLIVLNLVNKAFFNSMFEQFQRESFIHRFTAAEMIYLQYGRPEAVANGFVNHLIKCEFITVRPDNMIEAAKDETPGTPEEIQIMELLRSTGKITYGLFMKKLVARSTFSNIALSIEGVKKYIHKSSNYHGLFYLNFILSSIVFILGFERIVTGIVREKPIVFITVVVILALIAIIIHLFYLNRMMFTSIIPAAYERKVKAVPSVRTDWQWNYFLLGSAVFAPAFVAIADMTYIEQMNTTNNRTGNGGTSCGSSCGGGGSSCGSSCGGGSCGGCGGCGS